MFTKTAHEWFVNLRPTMLDDALVHASSRRADHEKLAAQTGATHSYEALPEMQDYERLTKDYMAKNA